jgi:hypothetical protein
MRRAVAAASVASVVSWSLLAFAQSAPPSPSPAPASPAPAPASPPAAAPSSPSPSEPAPAQPAPAAPNAPAAQPSEQPDLPADAPAPQPEPQPEAGPPPPGEAIPVEPKQLPATAAQTPEGKSETAPPANERAPVRDQREPDAWQEGHALAIELSGRVSGRLNAASSAANYEERAGLGIDGATWFTLSSQFALGFGVRRVDLGGISVSSGVNTIDAGYASTAIQLGMRAFPYRSENWDIFVGLRAGLAWQDVEANGLRQLGTLPDSAEPFNCSGVSGPGFAFGGEVGAAFRLSPRLWLTGSVDMSAYRLSADTVGECVPGIGAISALSGGLGLLFSFDLGPEAKLAGTASKHASAR